MQSISTKYVGASNTRGARIKATSASGISVMVPFDYGMATEVEAHGLAAQALAKKLGWSGVMVAGSTKDGHVFVFDSGYKIRL